jgi:hypothetical protein
MRYPDLWYPMYKLIMKNQPDKREQVVALLDPYKTSRRICEEAYKALTILGIIDGGNQKPTINQPPDIIAGKEGTLIETAFSLEQGTLNETAFRIWALNCIRNMCSKEKGRWNSQAHFLLIYDHLLGKNVRYLGRNDDKLAKEIDLYLDDVGCPVNFNRQKLNYWTRIGSYLGLTARVPGGATITFDQELLETSLKLVISDRRKKMYSSEEFLALIDHNLILIPEIKQGGQRVLPDVVSYAIWKLEREDIIKLHRGGDLGRVQLNGIPLIGGGSQVFTQVEIKNG